MSNQEAKWTKEIKPKVGLFEIDFKEIWRYKDLVRMFVFRDFVTFYKQTILGPIWFLIQPLFQAVINMFIFSSLAKIGPDGVPAILFYLSGPIVWQYFQESFTKTAGTFTDNQDIFGKVYFPRVIMPLSVIISNLLKFAVQLVILISFGAYFSFTDGELYFQKEIIFFPLLLVLLMFMAMGFGLLVTSLTSKYRDLKFLIDFGVPLFKYVTPGIATSMAIFKDKLPNQIQWVADYNPLGYVIDAFNFMFTGAGEISLYGLTYSLVFTCLIFLSGLLVFNQTEKTFMDTV